MATVFIVNGQPKRLEMLVNGIDASGDFIGNTSHGMDSDGDDNYIASQQDFDWWKKVIQQHEKMADIISQYKLANDPHEVDRIAQDWSDVDLEYQPAQVLLGLERAFGKLG
jgi:hypothetical protein